MAIELTRRLPIHKNYVKIPGGEIHLSTRLTAKQVVDAIPGSKIVRIAPSGTPAQRLDSIGLAHNYDMDHTDFYVELPPFDSNSSDASDWFAILLALAESA